MKKRKQEEPAKEKPVKEEKEKNKKAEAGALNAKNVLLSACMLLLTIVFYILWQSISAEGTGTVLPGTLQVTALSLALLFLFLLAIYKKGFLYDNILHLERFFAVYCIGLCLVGIQGFLPPLLWLFLPLAVMLVLTSGLTTGTGAFLLLLFVQYSITGSSPPVFLAYTCIGLSAILLFSELDTEFLFGTPLFAALTVCAVVLLAMDYMTRGQLAFSSFLYTAINLFVSFMLVSFVLKYVSGQILHKDRDKYQEINDPEYSLLTELKKTSPRSYYHAVHTAYFCEKIARQTGADEMLAKAGGYYHKIGKMRGQNNLRNALDIAREYNFPPQLLQLLREYGGKNTVLRSKEAAIVILSDAMVSSVTFLFEKNKDAVLDYEQITEIVFRKQIDSGILDHCELSMEQLTQIRRIFIEEKLYYDFLR